MPTKTGADADLATFLEGRKAVIRVRLTRVRGSAPRDVGTEMFVAPDALHGTIGGGRLEWMAITEARVMLKHGASGAAMSVPLGPDIGQCCGGHVEVMLDALDARLRRRVLQADAERRQERPCVLIFGAGHVGRALAHAFAPLPVRAVLIDSRAEELALAEAAVEKRLTALPEAELNSLAPGAAVVVTTHEHALDFLIAAQALAQGEAAYVGMIGSATKRAKFVSWSRENAAAAPDERLVCPIGAMGGADKRPEVIAAFTAAEIMAALAAHGGHGENR